MRKENCFSEGVLALYVEGDVPQIAAAIEKHLSVCAACRLHVEEFRESQSIFKSLGQGSVSSAALASVRSRVVDEVRRRENGSRLFLWLGRWAPVGFTWRYALASFAIVFAVSAVVRQSRVPEPQPNATVTVAATAPLEITRPAVSVTQGPAAPHPPKHAKRVVAPPKPKAATQSVDAEPHQIVMKIVTDDPNIIIYWLLDQKGDGE